MSLTESKQRLVDAVKAHATEHYEDGGWDVVVEAMSDEDIADVIGAARSENGAIKKVAEIVGVWADRQADAKVEGADGDGLGEEGSSELGEPEPEDDGVPEWSDETTVAIADGSYDEHLDDLARAIRHRRKALKKEAASAVIRTIESGDRVRIAGRIRPKYLIGCEGTVAGIKGRKVIVDLGVEELGRFKNAHELRVPAQAVEKV